VYEGIGVGPGEGVTIDATGNVVSSLGVAAVVIADVGAEIEAGVVTLDAGESDRSGEESGGSTPVQALTSTTATKAKLGGELIGWFCWRRWRM